MPQHSAPFSSSNGSTRTELMPLSHPAVSTSEPLSIASPRWTPRPTASGIGNGESNRGCQQALQSSAKSNAQSSRLRPGERSDGRQVSGAAKAISNTKQVRASTVLGNGPISLMKRDANLQSSAESSSSTPGALAQKQGTSSPIESSRSTRRKCQTADTSLIPRTAKADEGERGRARLSGELCHLASTAAGIIQLPADARAFIENKKQQQQQQTPITPKRSEAGRSSNKHGSRPSGAVPHRTGTHQDCSDRGSDSRPGRSEPRQSDGHQQLFDPKRHNALSFAKDLSVASASDARLSTAASMAMASAPSVTSSEGREKRRRRGGHIAASEITSNSSKLRKEQGTSVGKGSVQSSEETNDFVTDLKRVYHDICTLENKLKDEHSAIRRGCKDDAQDGRPMIGRLADGSLDHGFWLGLIEQHKKLIDLHNHFLDKASQPSLAPSVRLLPKDYEISVRLWQNGCHLLLELMRQNLPYTLGCHQGDVAVSEKDRAVQAGMLDHLTDFIYAAYTAYSNLLELEHLRSFRSCWLESLGDLARYRMLMAGLAATMGCSAGTGFIRNKSRKTTRLTDTQVASSSASGAHARIDDDQSQQTSAAQQQGQFFDQASVGSAALGDWDFEEKDTWRTTAKGWYSKGLSENPGSGRLHHHLAVLSQADDLRALHHFCKSLTAAQPFPSGRESILPLFDPSHQQRRVGPDGTIVDLFVHLHGMMFTHIELDNFDAVLTCFLSRLQERLRPLGWERGLGLTTLTMMASVNIAALMQYGADSAILSNAIDRPHSSRSPTIEGGKANVDAYCRTPTSPYPAAQTFNCSKSSPPRRTNQTPAHGTHEMGSDLPIALQYALRLSFDMLDSLITATNDCAKLAVNPYTTMLLTFLFRLARMPPYGGKMPSQLSQIESYVPWRTLARLSDTAHPHTSIPMGSQKIVGIAPLPEDWCLRGLSWAGRRLFERDFWKPSSENPKMSRSNSTSQIELNDIESEIDVLNIRGQDREINADGSQPKMSAATTWPVTDPVIQRIRWERIGQTLGALAGVVAGFDRVQLQDGRTRVEICAPLALRLERWHAAEQSQYRDYGSSNDACARRKSSPTYSDDNEVEFEDYSSPCNVSDDELEDDDAEPAEVKALKAKRRELLATLQKAQADRSSNGSGCANYGASCRDAARGNSSATITTERRPKAKSAVEDILPGYTVLVLDTNVLLAENGRLAQSLIEAKCWTVIVPLAVVTELDGLKRNRNAKVAEGAAVALTFLEMAVKTYSKWLRVQTSKGSYLPDLSIRTEDIDFGLQNFNGAKSQATPKEVGGDGNSAERTRARTLDEVILRCFSWQLEHFMDRLHILSADPAKERSKIMSGTPKVILVTLDRSLRLKTRAKGGIAAGTAELADILLLSTRLAEVRQKNGQMGGERSA